MAEAPPEAGCSSGSGDVLPGAAAQRLEEARTKRGRRCLKDERRKGDELCAFKLSEEIRTAAGHKETLREKRVMWAYWFLKRHT